MGATPPLARRPYSACALPPGLHLGIGRKRERETGTRPGLWCGEAEPEKRTGREGAGTALSCSLSAPLTREKGKGRRPGREWGLSPSYPDVRGAVWPDVLGVGPLSVPEDLGFRPFGSEFPGLTPRFSNTRLSAPQIPDIRDPGPNLSKAGALFYRISNIWGSGPCVHEYPGFIPPRVQISEPASPPFKYLGFRPHNQKSGIQQLSPSRRRRRTGPRGQIRLSPPPLQGRLPGPTSEEGQKPRKRWQGERSPCPSPCVAEPLEDPRRSRKRWGHHSDSYQVRHGVQGRGSLCLALRRKGAGPWEALSGGGSPAGPVVSLWLALPAAATLFPFLLPSLSLVEEAPQVTGSLMSPGVTP